jgi:Ca-activated chloride channel homolog
MNRRLAVRTLAAAGAGFFSRVLTYATLPSDEPAVKESGAFNIRSEVRLVLLDVSVTNPDGGFVTNLSRDDFTVMEDGRAQEVTVFDRGDVPVTCGLVVDESRSMAPKRSNVLTAATAFIEASNPNDEIFVLNFNDAVKPGLPPGTLFSGDIQQLRGALYRGIPEGKTAP